jgi:hypothetical protein
LRRGVSSSELSCRHIGLWFERNCCCGCAHCWCDATAEALVDPPNSRATIIRVDFILVDNLSRRVKGALVKVDMFVCLLCSVTRMKHRICRVPDLRYTHSPLEHVSHIFIFRVLRGGGDSWGRDRTLGSLLHIPTAWRWAHSISTIPSHTKHRLARMIHVRMNRQ